MAAAAGGRPEDKKDAKSTFDFAAKMPELMGQARAGVEQTVNRELKNTRIGTERTAAAKLALQRAVPDVTAANAPLSNPAQLDRLSVLIKDAIGTGKILPNTPAATLNESVTAALTAIGAGVLLPGSSPLTTHLHTMFLDGTLALNAALFRDGNAGNVATLATGVTAGIAGALNVGSEQKSISDNVGIGSTPNANSPLGKLNTRLNAMSNATGIADPVTQARLQNQIGLINTAAKTLTSQAFSFGAEVKNRGTATETAELKELKLTDAKPHIDIMQEGSAELKKVIAQNAHAAVAKRVMRDAVTANTNNMGGAQGVHALTQSAAAEAAAHIRAYAGDMPQATQDRLATLAAGVAAQRVEALRTAGTPLNDEKAALLGMVAAKELLKSWREIGGGPGQPNQKENAVAAAAIAAVAEAVTILNGLPAANTPIQNLQAVETAVNALSNRARGAIVQARTITNNTNNNNAIGNAGTITTQQAGHVAAFVIEPTIVTTATPNEITRQAAALENYNAALEAYCRDLQATADRLNKRAATPEMPMWRRDDGVVPVDPVVALGAAAVDPERKPLQAGEFKVADSKIPFHLNTSGTVNFKPKSVEDCKAGLALYLRKREESGGLASEPMKIDTVHPQYLKWMLDAVQAKGGVTVQPLSEAGKKALKDAFPKYKTQDRAIQGMDADRFVNYINDRIATNNATVDTQKQAVNERLSPRNR